jgi:hypothetical protein
MTNSVAVHLPNELQVMVPVSRSRKEKPDLEWSGIPPGNLPWDGHRWTDYQMVS